MTEIYNRRDIGYTIISRFEETFRNHLIKKLNLKHNNFRNGIPDAIVNKINDKSDILYWDDPNVFFENSDFPDLLEISIFMDNFKDIFPSIPITKTEFASIMTSLYSLRCKIAHVKGFFTSIDLDMLVDYIKSLVNYIDNDGTFKSLVLEIENNPDKVAIKVPISFNIDYLESNGIINNLPTPDYEYEGGFVGREDDIKEIIKFLERDKFPVVTITGAGGVGKTSLALKVIQEITQKPKFNQFDAIIWLSAKENKLSPFGIEDIEPTFKSFEDLLDTIIDVLGFGITDSESLDAEKKEEYVLTLFQITTNILVVIDNLETVTDERIINFIIDAPQNAKFLITSRKGLGQVERRYELKQLKEREAVFLFRQVAKDKQISSLAKLDDALIKKYVNKVSNYPLAIKWVIGQVARGRDINKIINSIDDASGDISRFCFEQIFGMLNENSRLILFALCCFEEAPTASLLRYVVEFESIDFDDCIEELILVSLVIPQQYKNEQNEIGSKFYILPLTKGYIRQQLSTQHSLKDKIQSKIAEIENTITATEQAKREYRFSLNNLGATTEEEKISAIFIQTAFQKYQAGLYNEAVDNYKKAVDVAPKFSSAYRNWAVIESYENHLSEADQLMQKAAELNPNDVQIWILWGNIKRKSNKITSADEKYERAYNISSDNHIVLNAYGQTRGRLGDFETALKLLYSALDKDNSYTNKHEIINRTSIAEALIGWSEVLLRERNAKDAEARLFDALAECNKIIDIDNNDHKTTGMLAKILYKIGKFYNNTNLPAQAKTYFLDCINLQYSGFKTIRYKSKSAVELSKIFIDEDEFEKVKETLTPFLIGNESVFRQYPEILSEINSLLDKVGNFTTFLVGKITYVNSISDYIIISPKDNPTNTFIAGKLDFNPIINSISKDLINLVVKFQPKVYNKNGREKRDAKKITIMY